MTGVGAYFFSMNIRLEGDLTELDVDEMCAMTWRINKALNPF